jgi:hypothetical protein
MSELETLASVYAQLEACVPAHNNALEQLLQAAQAEPRDRFKIMEQATLLQNQAQLMKKLGKRLILAAKRYDNHMNLTLFNALLTQLVAEGAKQETPRLVHDSHEPTAVGLDASNPRLPDPPSAPKRPFVMMGRAQDMF